MHIFFRIIAVILLFFATLAFGDRMHIKGDNAALILFFVCGFLGFCAVYGKDND